MTFSVRGLSENQIEILEKYGETITRHGFYLAGGTAFSIIFGHRKSVDFDWFTSLDIFDPMHLAQVLREAGMEFANHSIAAGTLNGISGSTRMSFIEYHYPLLQGLNNWQEYKINLASLDDLACMKLAAIAQRGLRKDFIDIYTIVIEYKPLSELLLLYKKKYQTVNIMPVVMGLAYFQNAENEPDPPLWTEKWSEVKKALSKWVKEIG